MFVLKMTVATCQPQQIGTIAATIATHHHQTRDKEQVVGGAARETPTPLRTNSSIREWRFIIYCCHEKGMPTMPKLPAKREAAATAATEPEAKKSKADAARASKARAREWAETRKKKKACTASDDRTADEENDVVADLPLLSAAPARKSSRRRGQSKVRRAVSAFSIEARWLTLICLYSGGSGCTRSGSRE